MNLLLQLMSAAVVQTPTPVTVNRPFAGASDAISWTCESQGSSGLRLVGSFPALSEDDQKSSRSYKLHVQTDANQSAYKGTFPGTLTGHAGDMSSYSILIPSAVEGKTQYVISLEFFHDSQSGFMKVAQFDFASGRLSAAVAGLCKTQVSK